MLVGVNYPWFDYGWDFGLGPPAWRGSRTTPRWTDTIDGQIARMHEVGLRVVRWFILGDGLTCGRHDEAPRPDPDRPGQWRYHAHPLGDDVLAHFQELLVRFSAFNASVDAPVRLLPVLVDFLFCEPGQHPMVVSDPADRMRTVNDPSWVKGGRVDAFIDAAKRVRFFDGVLEPLLVISQEHRDSIYAWELINEPEWITSGWHPDRRRNHPVDEASMRAFLEEGKQRIRRAGFKPTIGFARLDTLAQSGVTAEINQFHHYPAGSRPLPQHVFNPDFPAILGEFATADTDVWPELAANQSVLARLERIAAMGYPLALPWSFRAHDEQTAWSADVEAQIRAFVNAPQPPPT
jgi:hypothetical protein